MDKLEKEKDIKKIMSNVIDEDLIIPDLKKKEIGINLGSGEMYIPKWVNVDQEYPDSFRFQKLDVTHDLNMFPYPFRDNYANYIILHQVIEHVKYPLKTIAECHRILKKGGKLIMHYPHPSGSRAFLPYHIGFFNRNSFHKGNTPFKKRTVKLLYSQFHKAKLINWWINKLKNYYEKIPIIGSALFPAYEVQYEMIK